MAHGMVWGRPHQYPQFDTQTITASIFLYVRFQKKGHKCFRKGHTFCRKLHNFWFHKWVHFLVPEMGTSFYVSKGRTQKWVPNMSPFLEPENSDFGCRASVKYMIRSKLTNHVHKDCFYQAHMSCNTAPCLEVLQGF